MADRPCDRRHRRCDSRIPHRAQPVSHIFHSLDHRVPAAHPIGGLHPAGCYLVRRAAHLEPGTGGLRLFMACAHPGALRGGRRRFGRNEYCSNLRLRGIGPAAIRHLAHRAAVSHHRDQAGGDHRPCRRGDSSTRDRRAWTWTLHRLRPGRGSSGGHLRTGDRYRFHRAHHQPGDAVHRTACAGVAHLDPDGDRCMKALRSAFHLAALPIILIVVWWLTTRATTNIFVPKPDQLATTFIDVWVSERFLNDIVPSVARLLGGLVIAVVVGGLLGVLIGMFPKLRMALEPILEFLRALPAPVLVPVFMLVLGIGDGMKLTVIAFGCTWPILLNTIDGVRG